MHRKSSESIGLTFRSIATCEMSEATTSHLLTLSAAGSPAKILATQDNEQELTANAADYGESSTASFANYDPATSLWRTSQLSLFGGWEGFSGTWPQAGTMRNGNAYRLPPLVRSTDANVSSLLPTPTATDWKRTPMTRYYAYKPMNAGQADTTAQALGRKFFDTNPTAQRYSANPQDWELLMGFPIDWGKLDE